MVSYYYEQVFYLIGEPNNWLGRSDLVFVTPSLPHIKPVYECKGDVYIHVNNLNN